MQINLEGVILDINTNQYKTNQISTNVPREKYSKIDTLQWCKNVF